MLHLFVLSFSPSLRFKMSFIALPFIFCPQLELYSYSCAGYACSLFLSVPSNLNIAAHLDYTKHTLVRIRVFPFHIHFYSGLATSNNMFAPVLTLILNSLFQLFILNL